MFVDSLTGKSVKIKKESVLLNIIVVDFIYDYIIIVVEIKIISILLMEKLSFYIIYIYNSP